MTNFEEDTKKLKVLIDNTKKSGKQAWEAGEILSSILEGRRYKSNYKSFNDYTKREFNIQEETAKQYILIYQKIPIDLITDKMLVSHLYTIAEMQDVLKKQILNTLNLVEKESNDQNRLPYDGEMVLIFKQILESAKTVLNESELKKLFDFIKNKDNQEKNRRKRAKTDPETSPKLETLSLHKKYQCLPGLYLYTPISEQGLVGLFCTAFHLIKGESFLYKNYNVIFNKIVYIRTEFPDARVTIIKDLHNLSIFFEDEEEYIYIEFELNSFNFWRHKHHESTEECHLIVCWEIDKMPVETTRPPILSVKDLLKTGKIELY
ncbi:hypothetical protein N0Y54_43360 [Nostoc punctiforme UO1]|uniref:hypothetical protein n=1 Tax=Nostoc punctiforme TaxID=272131 RepID=UPI0030A534A7